MGEMKVEVISRDSVKPSSPTPTHLRYLQLSFLDQIITPVFMPMLLFYPADGDGPVKVEAVERSKWLKKTLSDALVRFCLLAGRVKDNLFVDCSDEGVPYMEARVDCKLAEVICHPDPMQLNKLLPYEIDNVGDLVLAIQINTFDCGGMAIGICISHKVADALSMVMFINGWAAVARDETHIICPRFGLAKLFPPVNISGFQPSTGITKEKIVTKRFVFSVSSLAALREKYADLQRQRPTRIEALSAFIWSRFVAATHGMEDKERVYTMLHAVNLRTRMDPPLPDNYFGNVSRFVMLTPSMESITEENRHHLVNQMREAVRKVDADYVKKLGEGSEHLNFLKEIAQKVTKGEIASFAFTSLCRFPLYEADFGWGKPIWVGSASLTFKNLVVFMDSGTDGGVEAWFHLQEEDMAKFQQDEDFLSFASPPSY